MPGMVIAGQQHLLPACLARLATRPFSTGSYADLTRPEIRPKTVPALVPQIRAVVTVGQALCQGRQNDSFARAAEPESQLHGTIQRCFGNLRKRIYRSRAYDGG